MIGDPLSPAIAQATRDPDAIARVLVQALPHIRRFAGRTVVVKMGGNALSDPAQDKLLAQDVLLLKSVGVRVVLVHGGGPQIDDTMQRLGMTPEFRDGLRVTDAETLDIVRTVLVGKINRDLVAAINREEPVAIGVAGEDGGLLRAAPRDPKLGFVGDVTAVNASFLQLLLDDGLGPGGLHRRRGRGRPGLQHQRRCGRAAPSPRRWGAEADLPHRRPRPAGGRRGRGQPDPPPEPAAAARPHGGRHGRRRHDPQAPRLRRGD
jgi:hypothetical protein